MSKEDLVFPGKHVVRVKDPSALEFPEVPRAQTGGVKHDLVFPEGEEAREANIVEGSEASEAKRAQASEASEVKSIQGKEAQESYAGCVAPGRVFAFRALTAVAAVALVGLGVVAVRPLDGRLRPVLAVPALAVASVVAGVVVCGSRFAR